MAVLIERKMIPVPPHRPRIPAYDRSDIEIRLLLGVNAAQDYVKEGHGVQAAIAKAAQDFAIAVNTLADAYAKRRTVGRRISKRRGVLK